MTPWTKTPTAAQTNALVNSVLNGKTFFNPQATTLSIPTTMPNYGNTKQLFALYQGLTALQDLATQANAPNISSFQVNQLQSAFARGMQQMQSYLGGSPFVGFNVAQGQVSAAGTSSAGVTTETDKYTTGVLATGDANTAVPAFAGAVQFAMQVTLPSGASKTVNFDLADMGSTPRTMSNVITYLNSQLQAAGVAARFADVLTQQPATSTKVAGQTITTPAGPNQYALQDRRQRSGDLDLLGADDGTSFGLHHPAGRPAGLDDRNGDRDHRNQRHWQRRGQPATAQAHDRPRGQRSARVYRHPERQHEVRAGHRHVVRRLGLRASQRLGFHQGRTGRLRPQRHR